MDNSALKDLTYGVYVLTSSYNDENAGCIINSAVQITSTTSIISISVNKENYTNEVIKHSKKFALSILSEQSKPTTIGTFGFKTSRNYNKFENLNIIKDNNLPIVNDNICGYLICEVTNIISVDTHDIILAKIVDCKKLSNLTPMTYAYYHNVIKGTSPKNAPTYIEENKNINTNTYKCLICGYEYNESSEEEKFKSLSKDWVCPICGAPKEMFELV